MEKHCQFSQYAKYPGMEAWNSQALAPSFPWTFAATTGASWAQDSSGTVSEGAPLKHEHWVHVVCCVPVVRLQSEKEERRKRPHVSALTDQLRGPELPLRNCPGTRSSPPYSHRDTPRREVPGHQTLRRVAVKWFPILPGPLVTPSSLSLSPREAHWNGQECERRYLKSNHSWAHMYLVIITLLLIQLDLYW